jgi:hypothetical protein
VIANTRCCRCESGGHAAGRQGGSDANALLKTTFKALRHDQKINQRTEGLINSMGRPRR